MPCASHRSLTQMDYRLIRRCPGRRVVARRPPEPSLEPSRFNRRSRAGLPRADPTMAQRFTFGARQCTCSVSLELSSAYEPSESCGRLARMQSCGMRAFACWLVTTVGICTFATPALAFKPTSHSIPPISQSPRSSAAARARSPRPAAPAWTASGSTGATTPCRPPSRGRSAISRPSTAAASSARTRSPTYPPARGASTGQSHEQRPARRHGPERGRLVHVGVARLRLRGRWDAYRACGGCAAGEQDSRGRTASSPTPPETSGRTRSSTTTPGASSPPMRRS